MKTAYLIPAIEFCRHYNIELSFIQSLNDSGLIEITIMEEKLFVPESQLLQLEKMVRLYYEMNINLEGIETIGSLLPRTRDRQQQVTLLLNRLSLSED